MIACSDQQAHGSSIGADFAVAMHYADDSVLVLEKPPGLLCVPGRGPDKQDCLSARVQRLYPDALIVHRLDMATSGLMLMARGRQAQSTLSQDFAARRVGKRYQALVHGSLPANTAPWNEIDLPIAPDWPNRPLRIISPVAGKPSRTRWRVAGHPDASTTRVELEPVTGRSHQLRVHLKAIGHPIVGDPLYGDGTDPTTTRLMLHACQITFTHPLTGAPMQFCSQPDF